MTESICMMMRVERSIPAIPSLEPVALKKADSGVEVVDP
jgi:hypothetical protein